MKTTGRGDVGLLGLGLTGPGVLSLGSLFGKSSAGVRPVSELVEGGVR